MVVDHIGIAVRSISKAIPLFENNFGYKPVTEVIENTRQKVRVVFLEKKGSLTIKLIEPSDPKSPVVEALKKGQILHHLCFRCDDLPMEILRQQEMGSRLLVAPQPGEAFGNNDIAFIHAGMGLNIELIDTDQRAGWLRPSPRKR